MYINIEKGNYNYLLQNNKTNRITIKEADPKILN